MDNSLHKQFLTMAINLATHNITDGNGGPFGAVITKNNTVISMGTNLVTEIFDPSAHAEITAIRAACKKLKDFQLTDCVVYSSCEPCPMCLGALYWARPKAIYFASSRQDAATNGFDDSFIYSEINLPIEKKSLRMTHLKVASHTEPFLQWNQKKNKTTY